MNCQPKHVFTTKSHLILNMYFFFSKTSTGDFVSKLYVYGYIMKRWFFKSTSIKDAWTQLEVWLGVGTTAVPEKGALNSLNHFKIAKSLTFELYEYYLT